MLCETRREKLRKTGQEKRHHERSDVEGPYSENVRHVTGRQ